MPKEVKDKNGAVPKKGRAKPPVVKKTAVAPKKAVQKKVPVTDAVVRARTDVARPAVVPPAVVPAAPARKPRQAPPRPVRPQPAAPAMPRTSSASEKNRTAVVFALGVMAVAVVIFFAIRYQTTRPPSSAPAVGSAVKDQALTEVESNTDFQSWISKWQTVDPYVNQNEFSPDGSGAIALALPAEAAVVPLAASLQPPLANRYVWSPDKTKFLDYLARFGEPDMSVTVYDRDGRGLLETLASCGTDCQIAGAFWLDSSRAVVVGSADDVKDDGTPLCIRNQGSAGDMSQRCYRHLTLTVYDFAGDRQLTYRSDKHTFATDPFTADTRARWLSGLSDADQAAFAGSQTAVVLHGAVSSIAADAGIVGVVDQNHQVRLAVMSPSAVIRDPQDAPMSLTDVVIGSQADVVTLQNGQGQLTVLSLRILSVPLVTFTVPSEGDIVHRRFTVRGTAATSAGNIVLRVADMRLQQTIISVTVHPDAAKGGAFSTVIDLHSHGVVTDDTLHIDAVPESNVPGEAEPIGVNVQYRP